MAGVEWWWVTAAAVVGIAAGSTVRAVVFHHAVLAEQPWRTRCPACDIDVVRPGWGVLASALGPSGRCRSCTSRIGPPVAVVELFAAATLGLLAWRHGPHIATIGIIWAALVAVALAFVDIAVHRLPDRLVIAALAGLILVFAIATVRSGGYQRLAVAVGCGAGCGLAYLILVLISPGGMGLGDAKLAVLVGLAAGWFGIEVAIFATVSGILYAGLVAIGLLVARRASRRDQLPYGPFMLLGALTAIITAST